MARRMSVEARPNVSVGDADLALRGEILRTLCGSDVHGMAIEGTDDRDEMGVFIEPPENVVGLAGSADHYVSRTKPDGERSGPGDVDLTLYSLRKYMRLATDGNPTVLTVLYAPESAVLHATLLGNELRHIAPAIVSRRASRRFLGYLDGQRERMVGGGKQNRVPNRPELIERYGFDTKYASHALRLGLQGIELTETGRLPLPLRTEDRLKCRAMKTGGYSFAESVAMVDDVRARLAALIDDSRSGPLRDEPDWPTVNAWMMHAHQSHWRAQ